jgi:hypothetical protein
MATEFPELDVDLLNPIAYTVKAILPECDLENSSTCNNKEDILTQSQMFKDADSGHFIKSQQVRKPTEDGCYGATSNTRPTTTGQAHQHYMELLEKMATKQYFAKAQSLLVHQWKTTRIGPRLLGNICPCCIMSNNLINVDPIHSRP